MATGDPRPPPLQITPQVVVTEGVTLRDAFAIAALPQCMAILAREGNLGRHSAALSAWEMADAMLAARGK